MNEVIDQLSPNFKYKKTNQILASYNDFVCYYAIEKETLVQVFWYEFVNDTLKPEEQINAFKVLNQVKSIQSPYLMNILDVGMIKSPPRFIVITEGIEGPFLSDYLKQIVAHPPPKIIMKWFKTLVNAVSSLHLSPLEIVHGNITPSIVFINPSNGFLKLRMPFSGLSGRLKTKFSVDFDVYKAPERLRGIISPSNDIWSLGILLLELLTHKPAYEEYNNPIDLFDAIVAYVQPLSLKEISNIKLKNLIEECLKPEMFRLKMSELLNSNFLTDEFINSLTQ